MPFETLGQAPRRIAVIGGGISGMAAAHLLADRRSVVLLEADPRLGGHARTVLAGKRAWGLALSPDEAVLYVTNGLSDDMTLIDTRQGKAIRTVAAGRVPHTPLVLAR